MMPPRTSGYLSESCNIVQELLSNYKKRHKVAGT